MKKTYNGLCKILKSRDFKRHVVVDWGFQEKAARGFRRSTRASKQRRSKEPPRRPGAVGF